MLDELQFLSDDRCCSHGGYGSKHPLVEMFPGVTEPPRGDAVHMMQVRDGFPP